MNNKLKKNSILNLVKSFSQLIFPLITFPYISRVLGPENIGKINFSNSYVSYFSLIAMLGISTYAIRECSKVRNDREKLDNTASQIFSMNLVTTIIALIILTCSLIVLDSIQDYKVLIIVLSTNILFTTLGCEWINNAMEDFQYITIRTLLFQIVSFCLMITFVKTKDDYLVYAMITVLSACGANIFNIKYREKFCKIKFTFKIKWKKHLIPIMFLFVMTLSQTIFNSADITMLGFMKGNAEVGLYSTALKIEQIISQLLSSMVFVLIPRLSYMFAEENYEVINKLLRNVLSIFIILGLPCFVGVISIAREIITIFAGNNYIGSVLPLQVLMFSFLFSLIGGGFLGNIVLLSSGKEKTYMIICCISTLINIILNYIFIPFGGAIAASFTTAFSSFIIMLLLIISIDKRVIIKEKSKIFISPFIGSVLIFVFCGLIKSIFSNSIIIILFSIIGSVLLYTIVLISLKNEMIFEIIETIIKKRKDINL